MPRYADASSSGSPGRKRAVVDALPHQLDQFPAEPARVLADARGDLARERRREPAALREEQLEEAAPLLERLEHRLGERVDARLEPLGRQRLVEQLEEVLPLLLDDPQVEVVLAGKELVDPADAEPGFPGDVADRGGVEPAIAEDPLGGLDEAGQIGFPVAEAARG